MEMEMKKMSWKVFGLLMIFVLGACSSDVTQEGITQSAGSPTDVVADETPSPQRGALGLQDNVQIMVGTFLLEGTEDEVTAEQAAELTVLWKAFRTLSSSDNVAIEELEALINQIQDTMNQSQLERIEGMEIVQEDMFTLAQDLGIVAEDFSGFGRGEGDGEGFPEGGFPGGGFPGGELPGGPGGQGPGGQGPGGVGGDLDPDAIATARAERGGGPAFGGRLNSFLLDPLIELLESKITT
jgi:hypothetical protein